MDGPFASPDMNEVHAYWLAKRGQRRMPSRWDIDPGNLRRLLRNLMLVDVLYNPIRFRYRLIGTNIVDAAGEDRTGQCLESVFAANPSVREQYVTAVASGEPVHGMEPVHRVDMGLQHDVERLLLPLSPDDVAVDMLLAYFDLTSGGAAAR